MSVQWRGKRVHGALWVLVYLIVAVAPLFVMLIEPRPSGRPFLRDFSVAIAFTGMSVIGIQFALTARIPSLKRPFGSDVVYFFHHQISAVAFGLVVLHIILLIIDDRDTLNLFRLPTAPIRARFAVVALACLVLLIVLSVLRKRLRLEYVAWRITHGLLAMAAAALAMTHMQLVGIYLASPWKRALWAVYVAVWIGTIAYARIVRPLIMKLRPYEVECVEQERGGAWSLRLRPVGHRGAAFHPGQFAWLTVGRSPFADLEHPFSYSSSASRPDQPRFTIKALGNFTSTVGAVAEGTRVYVDGPFGAFTIDRRPKANAFVFVAGGVGITPIMSMLESMRDRGDRRASCLLYAARDLDSMTFLEELRALEREIPLTLLLVPMEPPAGWSGHHGRISAQILEKAIPDSYRHGGAEVFLCGPLKMMDAVEETLVQLGIPPRCIHTERFNLA